MSNSIINHYEIAAYCSGIIVILGGFLWWFKLSKQHPQEGWQLLETPHPKYYRLYHCGNQAEDVRIAFNEMSRNSAIKKKLQTLLNHDFNCQLLDDKIAQAEFYVLKPDRKGRVFAWAQTAGQNDPTVILGYEPFLPSLGLFYNGAIKHELTHCAQEVTYGALRSQWEAKPLLKNIWLWTKYEIQAHILFYDCILMAVILISIFMIPISVILVPDVKFLFLAK